MNNQYFKVIQFKTAKLFEACGSLAGISNENSPEIIDSYSKIGLHFGIIFQLIDDILGLFRRFKSNWKKL